MNGYKRGFSPAPKRRQTEAGPRLGWCEVHDKQTYSTRKAARAEFKKAFPGERGLNAFRCSPERGWHFGHLKEGDRG